VLSLPFISISTESLRSRRRARKQHPHCMPHHCFCGGCGTILRVTVRQRGRTYLQLKPGTLTPLDPGSEHLHLVNIQGSLKNTTSRPPASSLRRKLNTIVKEVNRLKFRIVNCVVSSALHLHYCICNAFSVTKEEMNTHTTLWHTDTERILPVVRGQRWINCLFRAEYIWTSFVVAMILLWWPSHRLQSVFVM